MIQASLPQLKLHCLTAAASLLVATNLAHAAAQSKEQSCDHQRGVYSSILKVAGSAEEVADRRRLNKSADDHRLMDVALERYRAKLAHGMSSFQAKREAFSELKAECRTRQPLPADSAERMRRHAAVQADRERGDAPGKARRQAERDAIHAQGERERAARQSKIAEIKAKRKVERGAAGT